MLSLTASNLLLTLVVLPGLVASVVLGPPSQDPQSALNSPIPVLVPPQNASLPQNTTEEDVGILKLVERSLVRDGGALHQDDSRGFREDEEGEQERQEPWTGTDNTNRTQEEEAPSLGGTGHGWEGSGKANAGGSAALCQGAAFLANLVTAASAITVAIIALDR